MKAIGSIKSDSSLKTNQGHDTTVQKEVAVKSIETLVEQGRVKKKTMWQNKQNVKKLNVLY